MPLNRRSRFVSSARQIVATLRREAFRNASIGTLERQAPRDVVAFAYHVVADEPPPHVKHLYRSKTPAEFEADIVYLKTRYRLPSWRELCEERAAGRQPARPSALVTFDDGMRECFDVVRPILLEHGVPCVFFVVASLVDNRSMYYRHKVSLCLERVNSAPESGRQRLLQAVGRDRGIGEFSTTGFDKWIRSLEVADEATIDRVCALLEVDVAVELEQRRPYMTAEQLRHLAKDGFVVGGHTVRHPRLQYLSEAECGREIVDSCEFVRSLLGTNDVPFAFPFDGHLIDREFLGAIVERHAWITLMFDTGGLARDAPFIVHRMLSDEPANLPAGQSGLENLIRLAYLKQLAGSTAV